MDRFTENTTPTSDGPGVVWYCQHGADMPTSFDHAGLNHSKDPGAASSANASSNDGTFKGSTSNPGLTPAPAPSAGVFRGSKSNG